MSIRLNKREVGPVTIVDVEGRITLNDGSDTLRDALRGLMKNGHVNILLRLKDVSYIDSSGLGELLNARTAIRKQGGHLQLLNLTHRVRELMQLAAKFSSIFYLHHEEEQAALRSFSESPAPHAPENI